MNVFNIGDEIDLNIRGQSFVPDGIANGFSPVSERRNLLTFRSSGLKSRRRWRCVHAVLCGVLLLCAPGIRAEIASSASLQQARQDQAMRELKAHTFPDNGILHDIGLALASYCAGDGAGGDRALQQMIDGVWDSIKRGQVSDDNTETLNWPALRIARIVFLFGHDGVRKPGLMSAATEDATKQLLWKWLAQRARVALVDPARDWWTWGSENHHLQNWCSMWSALLILNADPSCRDRKMADGASVAMLKTAFDAYFKRWIRLRATRGLFVEAGSPIYAKYSLSVFYNLTDLADDPELKRLAREFLDLFWTQFALEQIDGSRGGSRHRSKPGRNSITGGEIGAAWFHFGLGKILTVAPADLAVATTAYVPDPLITEILKARPILGEYEMVSRLPGRLDSQNWPGKDGVAPRFPYVPAEPKNPYNQGAAMLDAKCAATLRKTYAAPGFILGATMETAEPASRWAGFSTSYRWDGVLFARGNGSEQPGGAESKPRIFIQPKIPAKHAHYNAEWSVQDKGVLLIQRLPSTQATTQLVFFSKDLRRTEKGGWIFAEAAEAYAALKVVDGIWQWKPDDASYWLKGYVPGLGEWLAPGQEFSPIVLEVASKRRYANFEAFQDEILKNVLSREKNRVDYRSVGYGTKLSLFTDYSRPPLINDHPINYEPEAAYAGGGLDALFGGKKVRLRILGKERIFHFE